MCFTIAADAICCAGATICQCACCCCKNFLGTTFKEQIKMAYIFLNVIAMFFTVMVLYWLNEFAGSYISCPAGNDYCLGVSAVYRMSFVLMTMYAILIVFMMVRGEVAKIANQDFWSLKIVYLAGFFFGSLYIPNSFFIGYISFARVISGVYLIFQIVMLIDVFYLWGSSWISKYEQGNNCYAYLLVIASLVLYGSALTLNIYNFKWFGGCSLNVTMNCFTLILMIAITAIQLIGWNPAGSLICSGSMSLYITFQSFSAQASGPECNDLMTSDDVMSIETGFGFVMSIVALLYLTFATKESSSKVLKADLGLLESEKDKQKAQDIEQQVVPNNAISHEEQLVAAREIIKKQKQDELAPYETNQFIFFHTIMFITAVYMSMMITNWGAPDLSSSTVDFVPTYESYWIKMVSAWVAALIYIWTLVAPHIYPDREFN